MAYTGFSQTEIDDYFEWFDETNLSDYEKYKLAIEMQRNRMLEDIFVLRDGVPSALEAIAMMLGKKPKSEGG